MTTKKRAIPKQNLLRIIPTLKGREYRWGGNGKVVGDPFDCFGMLVEYTKLRRSFDILVQHKNSVYAFEGYRKFEDSFAMEMFQSYLNSYFLEVALPYKQPGDIISCKSDSRLTIGIYLGKKKMLITAPETNCIIISTEHYNIRKAYRWPLVSRLQHK
jgi:cell wall-associated NlpC family hydrolase